MTTKLYTKVGDKGYTSLFNGTMIPKSNIIMECIGTLDELNSEIGMLYTFLKRSLSGKNSYELNENVLPVLKDFQVHLFDIGSVMGNVGGDGKIIFDVNKRFVGNLERLIDYLSEKTPELKNFILPNGEDEISISQCHKVRTVVRRAERSFVHVKNYDVKITDGDYIGIYLNRLSDYFFALVRYLHLIFEVEEVKYVPSV